MAVQGVHCPVQTAGALGSPRWQTLYTRRSLRRGPCHTGRGMGGTQHESPVTAFCRRTHCDGEQGGDSYGMPYGRARGADHGWQPWAVPFAWRKGGCWVAQHPQDALRGTHGPGSSQPPCAPRFLPRERGERACWTRRRTGDGHRRRTVFGDGRRQPHWLPSDAAAARGRGCRGHPVRQLRARLARGGGEPGAGPAGDRLSAAISPVSPNCWTPSTRSTVSLPWPGF